MHPIEPAWLAYNRGSAAAALYLERRGVDVALAYASCTVPTPNELDNLSEREAMTAGCRQRLIACGLDPADHEDKALWLLTN